jgi:SAM-dependent methyltransferase
MCQGLPRLLESCEYPPLAGMPLVRLLRSIHECRTRMQNEQGKKPDYKYNANDDGLSEWVKNFTSRIGDGTGDIEETYLSKLKLIADLKRGQRFLDVGSGLGRIIELVRPSAGSLVGLEPDFFRFEDCYKHYHDGNRVQVMNTTTGEYKRAHPADRFDVVIVSMVLQHVSAATCDGILRDVRELLASDGVAIVATTHCYEERFQAQTNPTPQTAEAFDRYADDSTNQQWGIPVRMFSRISFEGAILRAGLQIIDWGQFTYIRPERLSGWTALLGVPYEALENRGISQYAVLRRGP